MTTGGLSKVLIYIVLIYFIFKFGYLLLHYFKQKHFGDVLYPNNHVYRTDFGSIVIKSTNTWQYKGAVLFSALLFGGAVTALFFAAYIENGLLFLIALGILYSSSLVLYFNVLEVRASGLTINGVSIAWDQVESYVWQKNGLHYRLCVYGKDRVFQKKFQTMLIPIAEKEKIEALMQGNVPAEPVKGLPV